MIGNGRTIDLLSSPGRFTSERIETGVPPNLPPRANLRVTLLCGYFDWFSGYQETALAGALTEFSQASVIAGTRVNPIFSDEHLARIGIGRLYQPGSSQENGVNVTRLPVRELRSMVWSSKVFAALKFDCPDVLVAVMPGQALPVAAGLVRLPADVRRIALYGDNTAMWDGLSHTLRTIKRAALTLSKGIAYALVNSRSEAVYGYTPETIARLRHIGGAGKWNLLPLAFDPSAFYHDPRLRKATREALEFGDQDTVVLSVGKFQPQKRVEWVVDSFRVLLADRPSSHLVIIGADDSDYSRAVRSAIASDQALNGATKIFHFVDHSQMNALFNSADVGVWPRMPAITIQQAMGTGLSVVLPNNQWVGHLIKPGSGAYFAPERRHGAGGLAEALSAVVGSIRGEAPGARAGRTAVNRWLSAREVALQLLTDQA